MHRKKLIPLQTAMGNFIVFIHINPGTFLSLNAAQMRRNLYFSVLIRLISCSPVTQCSGDSFGKSLEILFMLNMFLSK